eukprot:CAMPEP_0196658400 /NCGR_PEP_ID=MMETSP1086-20130531/29559_1 /TAXON_ID=77921 /ORGANISM="Cyanoptyche  gloeocystis , Strain SAG4.97" /LENGTH=648 /DNA_ID=CAMNT_0041991959 /DNA_START=462 /DNA_END=2408 /DNA_ORIENTATION=+
MKHLSISQLQQLANELRTDTIWQVSKTGGHLGAGLGVTELTVAMHYVFDTPHDRLIWDVGHQCYPHKILTGRRDRMRTIRQGGGLSGFTNRFESAYDPFGAGHACTSVSAAVGMAVARDLAGHNNHVIAVVGDGAMTGGMIYEAMNNAGYLDLDKLIVVLNDNGQVSLPTGTPMAGGAAPVGALASSLSRILASSPFEDVRNAAKEAAKLLPKPLQEAAAKADEYARGIFTGGTLFEELGFYYVGPVDGHDMATLVPIMESLRDRKSKGPVMLHVVTEKGRGYRPAELAPDKYHGVVRFDVRTGKQEKPKEQAPSYTKIFAEALIKEAEEDGRIVAITAAMPGGTGTDLFAKKFPERCFDVGIAEQHAVTFAGGMAAEGFKPFCAIYSTFLQRGYDQVVHDVALQNLPVRFIMDRAGLVGADGATHSGAYDLTYLGSLPNMVIMAPADEVELYHMIATAAAINDRPSAVRFPRGNGIGLELPTKGKVLPIGKGRIVRKGEKVAILSLGTRLAESLNAADSLKEFGLNVTVADARFAKPLDHDLIRQLAREHEVLITIEENAIGGFSSHVLHFLALEGLLDNGLKVRPMVIPDRFIEHNKPEIQYDEAGLNAAHISATVLAMVGENPHGKALLQTWSSSLGGVLVGQQS